MSELFHYTLRAESREALLDMLEAAQAGKEAPFVVADESGARNIDPARIRYPYEEITTPLFDPEIDDFATPPVPTGDWLCEVWLTDADSDLAAIAEAL